MTFVTNERERTGKGNSEWKRERNSTGAQGKVAAANSTHQLGLHPKIAEKMCFFDASRFRVLFHFSFDSGFDLFQRPYRDRLTFSIFLQSV